MGQLIIPNEISIKGPWILESSQLEELGEALNEINDKIDEAYEIELDRQIEEELPSLAKWNEKITKDEARIEVEKRYPFRKRERETTLTSKDGKRIKDSSVINILKDKNVIDFKPSSLQVEIEKGPISFKLEVSSKFDGELQTRMSIRDDKYSNEINYILNKWIRKNKPNSIVQFWSSTYQYFVFPLFFMLLFVPLMLVKSGKNNYQDKLKVEGIEILKNEIDDSNRNKAIELILKLETDYVPVDYSNKGNMDSTIYKIWLYGFICLVLLAIRPKTVIGIGKKSRLAWFYKKWIYIVTVFIPLTILLPIIKAKIL